MTPDNDMAIELEVAKDTVRDEVVLWDPNNPNTMVLSDVYYWEDDLR